MKLIEIITEYPSLKLIKGNLDTNIQYICSDSRKVQHEDIFIISSTLKDKNYILDSKNNGSKTCILEEGSPFLDLALEQFPNVLITNQKPELLQGFLASKILNYPSKKLKVFAVTGTNGKTTMTHLLYHFAVSLGFKAGIIGTLHAKYGNHILETGYTTPDSSTLQKLIYNMVEEGVEYVFIEASSHGLKLGRTNGLDIYAALFTNLTRDHLDFHPSMEDYLLSKFKLFELLEESSHPKRFGISVADDEGCKEMENLIQNHKVKDRMYFLGVNRDFEYTNIELGITGSSFRFFFNRKDSPFTTSIKVETNLLGRFNVSNLSLAIAAWIVEGIKVSQIPEICKFIPNVPGRFNIYYSIDRTRIAVVDYAHTPDALKNILESCKAMNPRQLICLFGCGGDRDRTKRPEMARIAEELSDFVIITSDNPRTENPEAILNDIEAGFRPDFKRYLRIEDRRTAIQKGIELLEKGGILAVCGKGHETYQIIGREKFYFNDGEEVEKAFQMVSE